MVALLIACLVSAPTDCRSYEMPLVESMPHMQMVEAQTYAVKWLQSHPGYRVTVRVVRGREA
jgi:hypothetical protein